MTDLARRSVLSLAWQGVAGVAQLVVVFLRSVLLARLLPVEVFGEFAGASAIVLLSASVAELGLGRALIHRAPETADEDLAASVHFSLVACLSAAWAVVMLAAATTLAGGAARTAVQVLTLTTWLGFLTSTPRLLLTRRVEHRRLAILLFGRAVLSSAAAIVLALRGATLWALLGAEIVGALVIVVGFYVWRPVWRIRFGWQRRIVRYLLGFGARSVAADLLASAAERLPDLWSRVVLGGANTGLLSRAEVFASYPRRVLSGPFVAVAGGTYAELKHDRERLSKAFFRANAVLVRGGFLLTGLLAVAAPELIRLLIGERWMPMLDAFRILLLFALVDSIKTTVADLFNAIGKPQLVVWVRGVQVAILGVGLVSLGPLLGIVGVAAAVSVAAVIGMVLMLWQARSFVDFSPLRLFAAPTAGLVASIAIVGLFVETQLVAAGDWLSALVKVVVCGAVFAAVVCILEGRRALRMSRQLLRTVRG